MRKYVLIIMLCMSGLGISQNQILFNAGWQIQKIKYQGVDYHFYVPTIPSPESYRNMTHFTSSTFSTELYNSFWGSIHSITNDQMTIINLGQTLMQSPDLNFDKFESSYSNLFNLPTTPRAFNYQITHTPPYTYQLILTDVVNGNQVFYGANILATETLSTKKIKIYPNPTSEILNIETPEEISLIKIFDLSGNLIQQTLNNGIKNLQIDLKHLPDGIYFLKLNEEKPIKFIKN